MYKVFWLRIVIIKQISPLLMKKSRIGKSVWGDDFAAINL